MCVCVCACVYVCVCVCVCVCVYACVSVFVGRELIDGRKKRAWDTVAGDYIHLHHFCMQGSKYTYIVVNTTHLWQLFHKPLVSNME